MGTSIDTNLIPHFSGEGDSKLWITQFQLMVTTKGLNDAMARTTLPLYLKDSALRWYISLEDDVKGDYDALKEAFQTRFEQSGKMKKKHCSRRNWLNWRMNKYCVKPVICFMLDIVTHLAPYITCLFLCVHLSSELLFFAFFYGDIWNKKISSCLRSICIKCVSDKSKQYLVFIICQSSLY